MGTPEIRRNLKEIRARYELEPCLKDVYVEGSSDHTILQWFLDTKGKRDIRVYHIDTVELPDHVFREFNLSKHSNRHKVIALAEILSRIFDHTKIKAKCIADADYDRYLCRCRNNCALEYTDYTCMEMYLFNELVLGKFLNFALRWSAVSPSELLVGMRQVLERMFLMRLANEKLNWNMEWIDIRKYVSWTGKTVRFEEKRFLKNYLTKNARLGNLAEFNSVMQQFQAKLHSDPRHNIAGHDFTYLFFLVVKRHGSHGGGFRNMETLEGALRLCLELDFVHQEPLFVKLGAL